MSVETLLGMVVIVAVTISVVAVVIAMIFSKSDTYKKKENFRLGEEWNDRPFLFSAVDEGSVKDSYYARPDDFIDPKGNTEIAGGMVSGNW